MQYKNPILQKEQLSRTWLAQTEGTICVRPTVVMKHIEHVCNFNILKCCDVEGKTLKEVLVRLNIDRLDRFLNGNILKCCISSNNNRLSINCPLCWKYLE